MKKFTIASIAVLTAIAVAAPLIVFFVMRDDDNPELFPIIRALPTATAIQTVSVFDEDNDTYRDIDLPPIIDYFTDGTYNFFLLEIGNLQHTYVSTIFSPTFTPGGNVTISMSETTTNEQQITTGTTHSVSASLSASITYGVSSTLSTAVQAGPAIKRASAGLSLTKNFSVTATIGAEYQWTTNISEALRVGNTSTFGVTIGPNAQSGYYRAAMFASAEIYVVLQTPRDNSALYYFEEVTIARSFTRRVEFSPNGVFDNTPTSPIYLHNMACEFFLGALPIPLMPVPVEFVYVSAGSTHSLAITTTGELWTWGSNDRGQTGLGTTDGNTLTPTRVGTATNWASVSASAHSLAITTTGELWAWGSNSAGGTGLGTTTGNTLVPTRVGTATNWVSVSTGSGHSLAITTTGELWAWGLNANGRTGLGPIAGSTLVPTQVGTATNWASVSAGIMHSHAITTTGELWAWGFNSSGRTGLGTTNGHTFVPTRVGTATNWASVSAGNTRSIGLTTTGELWAWGLNIDSIGNTLIPTQVGVATNWASVSIGSDHSLAITTAGELWAWGSNVNGRTGLSTSTGNTFVPTQVGVATNWASVSAGYSHSVIMTTTGEYWTWGLNGNGQLGDGTTINRDTPTLITFS
ncbi:MAG: hypothetical protein FWE16_05380 [Firmicutes bacterium]|nr:hypothetical protein [Bacillota bacterium]